MKKVNKEEYGILKGLDDKWKWIARDDNYDASLFCFEDKPYKSMEIGAWGPNVVQYEYLGRHDSKFQFIQWEDEEPYNIAKLIEEYEDKEFYDYVGWKYAESEEAEVNKDIQWLKKEIHKELEDWHGVEGGIDGDGINEIMLLINQLDQPELPVIPQWVADNIEDKKRVGVLLSVAIAGFPEFKLQKELNIDEHECNEIYARAWLDGYTVEEEEEQKYYVMNNDDRMMLVRMMVGKTITEADPFKLEDMYEVEKKSHRLTEQEIKDYDERYWAFRKPVEEVEE